MKDYTYSIKLSEYVYSVVPLWKLSITAQKTLNRSVKSYAPIETGNLQDSIQIKTSDFDNGILTIYVDKRWYKVPYYQYLNENDDKHYRRGEQAGKTTKGWWDRLCEDFQKRWDVRASALEEYVPKDNERNATAKQHKTLAESGNIRKLNGGETLDSADVPIHSAEEVEAFKENHENLRRLGYERRGYVNAPPTVITSKMSVRDMQQLSAENIQFLISRELGIKVPMGYPGNKRQFWKMRKQLNEISAIYGEVQIGGIPTRTLIRELIRKLENSIEINAI